jgi:hypothetical protein
MKIATFNVNNIKRRLPNLLDWLKSSRPDVTYLQELKCTDAEFSATALYKAGYAPEWFGTYERTFQVGSSALPLPSRTAITTGARTSRNFFEAVKSTCTGRRLVASKGYFRGSPAAYAHYSEFTAAHRRGT